MVRQVTKSRRRLKQVEAWLRLEFPVHRPVKVRLERIVKSGKDQDLGQCYENDNGWMIRVHKGQPLSGQIETLQHEWSHLRTRCIGHADSGGVEFWRIIRRWHDEDGQKDSRAL